MRERTTWDRNRIAQDLKKVAEDPRAMNQDHLQQQPAHDKYVIGGPSEFAEDVHGDDWKSEQGADGNTARNEIGMPEMRSETFNKNDKAPGESPKRASEVVPELVKKKADLCTKIARSMLPTTAAESDIEDQALNLMDLPDSNLMDMYSRMASQDEDEDDEGQSKQAQDEDEDEGQSKQAQDDEDEDEGQSKQAKKGQQQDQDKEAQDDEGQQSKEAKKGQQQQQAQDQDKEAQDEDQQSKEAGEIPPQFKENIEKMKEKSKDKGDDDKGQDKEARQIAAMAKYAADNHLKTVPRDRLKAAAVDVIQAIFDHVKAKSATDQQQLMAQVQQMVQQACQGLMGQGQQDPMQQQGQQQMQQGQQQMMSDDQLLDQMLQDDDQYMQQGQQMQVLAESDIQMETPSMDVGDVQLGAEDAILTQVFASGTEVRDAMEANNIQGLPNPEGLGVNASVQLSTPMVRTAATRPVGTQPSAGVSQLGGASAPSQGGDDINSLSQLWGSAPDVSGVFR